MAFDMTMLKRHSLPVILTVVLLLMTSLASAQNRGAHPDGPLPISPAPAAVGPFSTITATEAAELFRQGTERVAKNDFSGAESLLRRALTLAPDDPTLHHYLGYALWKKNNRDEADNEFKEALRLDPKNAYTLYFLGRIAAEQGSPKRAMSYYEAEIALGNPVYDTYQRLSQGYLQEGQANQALSMVQLALRNTPWDGSLHYLLARIYQTRGNLAAAKEEFDASSRLRDTDQQSIRDLLEM